MTSLDVGFGRHFARAIPVAAALTCCATIAAAQVHLDVSFQENESDGRLSVHGRDFDQLPAFRMVPGKRVFGRSFELSGNSLVQNDPGFTASDNDVEIDPVGLDPPVPNENVHFRILSAPSLLTELGGRNLSYWDGSGSVSICLDDVRISTNVLTGGQRALGTRESSSVRRAVLDEGRDWVARTFVVNDWYISAYAPIVDVHGRRVGMLHTSFLEAPYRDAYVAAMSVLEQAAVVAESRNRLLTSTALLIALVESGRSGSGSCSILAAPMTKVAGRANRMRAASISSGVKSVSLVTPAIS